MQPGKRISTVNRSPSAGSATISQFDMRLHLEEDNFNLFRSGLTWTHNLFLDTNPLSESFVLPGLTGNTARVRAKLFHFKSYWEPVTTGEYTLSINSGGAISVNANQNVILEGIADVVSGINNFILTYTTVDDTLQRRGLDWLEFDYSHTTRFSGNAFDVYLKNHGGQNIAYRAPSYSSSTAILDVTDPFNVLNISTSSDSLFSPDPVLTNQQFHFYNPTQTLAPKRLEMAELGKISEINGADYLVIAHSSMAAEVNALLQHRSSHNGYQTQLIHTETITNEFGFGRQDPTAIRNFIKFAADHWSPAPQFVALAGNGYYDYRNITGEFPVNWVPTYQISGTNDLGVLPTDDYLVDVVQALPGKSTRLPIDSSDDFVIGDRQSAHKMLDQFTEEVSTHTISADIAVGRFPADNNAELTAMIQKTINSEIHFQPGPWRNQALVIADDEFVFGNNNEFFFTRMAQTAAQQLRTGRYRERLLAEREFPFVSNERPTATRYLIDQLNSGSRITVFYGHSDQTQWTHENLLLYPDDLSAIKNDGREGFYWGIGGQYKRDELTTGIVPDLLKRSSGGFFAAVTASHPVFVFQSDLLQNTFWKAVADNPDQPLAELFRQIKGSTNNDQKYSFLGDPAITLRGVIDQITFNNPPDSLIGGDLVTIAGTVAGQINVDSIYIEVIEPGILRTLQNPATYRLPARAIFRGWLTVNNGTFSTGIRLPIDLATITPQTQARFMAYAIQDDRREAYGLVDSLLIGGGNPQIVENVTPQIQLAVIEAGGPILVADLSDTSGINLSAICKHEPLLFIDGNRQDTLFIGDYFRYDLDNSQSGTLRYPLPLLSASEHQLTLEVHDNYNNKAIDSINIVLNVKGHTPQLPQQITLKPNYPNPFNPVTVIPFELHGSNFYDVKLEIYNVLGQKVRTLLNDRIPAGNHEVHWDGSNDAGNSVASGMYVYRLRVSNHLIDGKTSGEIQVLHRKMLMLK